MAGHVRDAGHEQLVASYADRRGRRHRIVRRGRLVLDLAPRARAVLVAVLSEEEGIDQARAVVAGGEFDVGYLARARAGESPLGRRLTAAALLAMEAAPEDDDDEVQARAAA